MLPTIYTTMKQTHNNLNSNSSTVVNWTRPLLNKFKMAYALAADEGKDVFIFEDNGYTVGYAYYLITFLEGELA